MDGVFVVEVRMMLMGMIICERCERYIGPYLDRIDEADLSTGLVAGCDV